MIELVGVTKDYGAPGRTVRALAGIDLAVRPGERLVIMGPSGSGKSTLLNLLAGLDRPTAGRVVFDGQDLGALSEAERAAFRRRSVGMVFQFFNLIPTLTALENVALPLELGGGPRAAPLAAAARMLEQVGLASCASRFPEELSGGEMQRVAVARALVAGPRLLIADEPTGSLDSPTGARILDLIAGAAGGERALVMVTHDPRARRIASRSARLEDGRLVPAEE